MRLLRVGFVALPIGSTGMGTGPGSYTDPLPELRPTAGARGLLAVAPRRWGAMVLLYQVRTSATRGVRRGTVELVDSSGDVYARHPFSLDVRRAYDASGRTRVLLQPGDGTGAMKTLLGVEGDRYWLGHPAMRNGPSAGYPTQPDRLAQLRGLARFLDGHGVSPLTWPLAEAERGGSYSSCARAQLTRYVGAVNDIAPTRPAFPVRVLPSGTIGCDPNGTLDDYNPVSDVAGTPGIAQDDVLDADAQPFWARVFGQWVNRGWIAPGDTYVANPFNEPSNSTVAQRTTMRVQVSRATTRLRRATRGRAHVFLSTWPRDERSTRRCAMIDRRMRCATFERDVFGNRDMWDGVGLDDPHVWMSPFSRLQGRPNTRQTIQYGLDRTYEYRARLRAIKRLPRGREVWAYHFHTATRTMPQLVIDAPGHHARMTYWLLARDGHSGLFVSNSMIGWSGATRYHPGTRIRSRGNPFRQATYYHHPRFGYAAGWGTFVYPPWDPILGLIEERDRDTAHSRPTSSLRLEGMRDGQEDANLVLLYRQRFGDSMVALRLRGLFPDRTRRLPSSLGNVVGPTWSDRRMARRMEAQRRIMIRQLANR